MSDSHTRKPVIAIDGPAASGKSTTAKRVAHCLDFIYVDTGAMYRAITLKVLRELGAQADNQSIIQLTESTDITLKSENGLATVWLDGEDVSELIRLPDVSAHVSRVAAIEPVRHQLVVLQRRLGDNGGVVMDGRDIGTTVFPEAEVKVFIVASIEERARRRLQEMRQHGVDTSLDEQIQLLRKRDWLDSERAFSPLAKAADAYEIDTSLMGIDQQVEAVLELVRLKTNS